MKFLGGIICCHSKKEKTKIQMCRNNGHNNPQAGCGVFWEFVWEAWRKKLTSNRAEISEEITGIAQAIECGFNEITVTRDSKYVTPRVGIFWPQVYNLNNLGRRPLNEATYIKYQYAKFPEFCTQCYSLNNFERRPTKGHFCPVWLESMQWSKRCLKKLWMDRQKDARMDTENRWQSQ